MYFFWFFFQWKRYISAVALIQPFLHFQKHFYINFTCKTFTQAETQYGIQHSRLCGRLGAHCGQSSCSSFSSSQPMCLPSGGVKGSISIISRALRIRVWINIYGFTFMKSSLASTLCNKGQSQPLVDPNDLGGATTKAKIFCNTSDQNNACQSQ